MNITTKFSCGDKAWVFYGEHVRQLTVGQIRVQVTGAARVDDWDRIGTIASYSGGDNGQDPDNYAEQTGYEEVYMCNETGIGSGSLFTFGQHIFLTQEECEAACAEQIAERVKREKDCAEYQQQRRIDRIASLRAELLLLESK